MKISELSQYRAEIDALDAEILRLLNFRARKVLAIGKIKKHAGKAVLDADRETDVLARLESLNQGPLQADGIRRIWQVVFAVSRNLEDETITGR